jgi:hypothetical protein
MVMENLAIFDPKPCKSYQAATPTTLSWLLSVGVLYGIFCVQTHMQLTGWLLAADKV